MTDRDEQLRAWVAGVVGTHVSWQALAGDASHRCYSRIQSGSDTYIVMDAPPDVEDCRPFVRVAQSLAEQNVLVPEICAQDVEQGFLLLSDFGDVLLLDLLQRETADHLYGEAIQTIFNIQKASVEGLPLFDRELYDTEFLRFEQWYWVQQHGRAVERGARDRWATIKQTLISELLEQPCTFVHRDYHSRNLMWVDQQVGVLDFQDAVWGPITYDLMSLLRDCYIDWPEEQVSRWLYRTCDRMNQEGVLDGVSHEQFHRWFDWASIQRHIKCLGIFARLNARDQKSSYLSYMPRVEHYIHSVSARYPELSGLSEFLGAET